MLFDTHCHLDRYPDPMDTARCAEKRHVVVFAMTALPSHFEVGWRHVQMLRGVRLALGLHPALAAKHGEEVTRFRALIHRTSYVGEIGLDFSRSGAADRSSQLSVFHELLDVLADRPRFISLHSRRAEREVLAALRATGIRGAVLHWFSGPKSMAIRGIDEGHFFSVNPAMIRGVAGQKLIRLIPSRCVLTETDGPYVHIGKRPARPSDIRAVVDYLAQTWGISAEAAEEALEANVRQLLSKLPA